MNQPNPNESPIDSSMAAPPPVVRSLEANPTTRQSATAPEMFQSRGIVLAILFLVTGVLGIPLLWINRNFSTTERIVWTIIVTIYTTALVAFTAGIVWWAYQRLI